MLENRVQIFIGVSVGQTRIESGILATNIIADIIGLALVGKGVLQIAAQDAEVFFGTKRPLFLKGLVGQFLKHVILQGTRPFFQPEFFVKHFKAGPSIRRRVKIPAIAPVAFAFSTEQINLLALWGKIPGRDIEFIGILGRTSVTMI